ncbi:GNAT family N-acetyltransferase [Gymnodinialimonas sp.]
MAQRSDPPRPSIRRLWRSNQRDLIDHFLRLDDETRRLRFGRAVDAEFVTTYALQVLSVDAVIFGAVHDGKLRGVAELRGLLDSWPRSAEAALSVEADWQDNGLGEALLTRLIAAARNRGIKKVHMLCLRENARMRALALKNDAALQFNISEVEAELTTPWPTPVSVFRELFGDTDTYIDVLFQQKQ